LTPAEEAAKRELPDKKTENAEAKVAAEA